MAPKPRFEMSKNFTLPIGILITMSILMAACQPLAAVETVEIGKDIKIVSNIHQPLAVVLSDPADPYYALAEEIAQEEGLPLTDSLEDALSRAPAFLLWVVSPEQLSDQVFSEFGLLTKDPDNRVSTGIISGSNIEQARALWQRKLTLDGPMLSVVPREGTIETYRDGKLATLSRLTKKSLVDALADAVQITYQGHGTRRYWVLDEGVELAAGDIPELSPLVVNAFACQTFRLWTEGSIALAFTDQGAAAYAGFVHSPNGYGMGEPKGFPMQYTWPEFPIGHVMQVQNRGLLQGFLNWPFYILLGDPRLSFNEDAPYRVLHDDVIGETRRIEFAGAPQGVVPVFIPGGAKYNYVRVSTAGSAWRGDPFYDSSLQMTNVGPDKFLLFEHPGGDFSIQLFHRVPWYVRSFEPLGDAFDHSTVIYNAPGSIMPNYIMSVILLLAVGWLCLRKKRSLRSHLPAAVIVGLCLALIRGGYALLRQSKLISMYTNYMRTMDVRFEASLPFLVSTFLLAACGAWLFLNSNSRWGRGLALLGAVFPGWAVASYWLGASTFINILARRRYGAGLYGYGIGSMALITFLAELAIVLSLLTLSSRRGVGGLKIGAKDNR